MTTPPPAAPEGKALALPIERIRSIEEIAKTYGLTAVANMGQMETTLTIAKGIELLEAALTPDVIKPIMRLQNTRLGFLTDAKQGYDEGTVKRCIVEALMRGVRPVMNEMNIIASNFYATREAFTRLLKEYPGLTDLRIELGVPLADKNPKTAVVECSASWFINGVGDEISAKIPIRVNDGSLPDAILGKADRKIKSRIYWRLTGSESQLPEGDATENARNVTPASGTSGLDAFAGSGAVVDVKPTEEPPKEEAEAKFLSSSKWAGLVRFAKNAKVTEYELQAIIAEITGEPFDAARLPPNIESQALGNIKQFAESKS